MGGVPNYFHPVGVWHSAWTQRSETATQFAIRISARRFDPRAFDFA
jgi:hypothetical protein